MANCPVCAQQIPDDVGLIECPNCEAPLMVHMDGRVEGAGSDVAAEESTRPSFGEEPPPVPGEIPRPSGSIGAAFESAAEPEVRVDETPAEPEPEPDPVAVGYSLDEDAASSDSPEYEAPRAAESADLSDIETFGNSDASSGRDGSLRYNLIVSGIDTQDVRRDFREAITDRKLMWDTDQILRAIKNGEVQINNVSAAKAFMVVTRLRGLPVRVRWEQYAVSQT